MSLKMNENSFISLFSLQNCLPKCSGKKKLFLGFLNRRIGTTKRATRKTITLSERPRNGLSNDAIFLKKYAFLLGVKNR